jgi:hypothetical protein
MNIEGDCDIMYKFGQKIHVRKSSYKGSEYYIRYFIAITPDGGVIGSSKHPNDHGGGSMTVAVFDQHKPYIVPISDCTCGGHPLLLLCSQSPTERHLVRCKACSASTTSGDREDVAALWNRMVTAGSHRAR